MESSSASSVAQYTDSFNSLSSSIGKEVSEVISSRTGEAAYTSDSFNSLTTESVHTLTYRRSHESSGGDTSKSKSDTRFDIFQRNMKLSYNEDTFESANDEYSSEDENSVQYVKQDEHVQSTLPITERRLDEMKIENIRHRMKKKVDEVVEHDIKTCPVCVKAKEKITEKQFVCRRKTLLQNKLIEDKIQRHLVCKNSLDLIGELAASLPKPSDDPQEIWSRLLNS
ncbi:uncharacterized protein LOC117108663 [Anneissia japonica]|uniref:uncharacterized protein LOC117108663 n=1 Tax=Anneissia japonica TaxID=1529436 RepID=UPI0014259BF7|nr:uncharacterized protein LOC117108663 [Anneissia japonica]